MKKKKKEEKNGYDMPVERGVRSCGKRSGESGKEEINLDRDAVLFLQRLES